MRVRVGVTGKWGYLSFEVFKYHDLHNIYYIVSVLNVFIYMYLKAIKVKWYNKENVWTVVRKSCKF